MRILVITKAGRPGPGRFGRREAEYDRFDVYHDLRREVLRREVRRLLDLAADFDLVVAEAPEGILLSYYFSVVRRPQPRMLVVDTNLFGNVDRLLDFLELDRERVLQGAFANERNSWMYFTPSHRGRYLEFGVPAVRLHHAPPSSEFLENVTEGAGTDEPDPGPEPLFGGAQYVFAGGRFYRDYPTVCAACDALGLNLVVAAGGRETNITPGERVVVLGPLSFPAFSAVLGQARVSVISLVETDNNAGQGVLIHSWRERVPVVAARMVCVEDLAEDGIHALLVPAGDPSALARAIERLLDDAPLCDRLVAAGAARDAEFQDHLEAVLDRVFADDQGGEVVAGRGSFSYGLTTRCQHRCLHCIEQDLRREEVPDRSLEAIAAEAEARAGRMKAVALVNGESTLHPEFLAALRLFRDRGLEVYLTTNGAAFADAAFLARAVEAGLCGVDLTIHSLRAELEDRICGVAGAFDDKTAALTNLGRVHGLALKASLTIIALNHAGLEATVTWLHEQHGLAEFHFKYVVPLGGAARNPDLVPAYSDAVPDLAAALSYIRKHDLAAYVSSVPRCLIAEFEACYEFIPPGRVADEAATNLLAGCTQVQPDADRSEAMYTFLEPCEGCARRDRCNGVIRNYVALRGEPALRPF